MPDPTTTEPATATTASTTATTAATETATQTQGDPADKPLGENGEKALKAERERANAAEKARADLQKQIDAINQANESAVEKAQREAKEAQEAATKATADALRFRVAAKHSISEEDAELFLTGTDEATLERQAARLAERASSTTTAAGPRPDLTQGGNPTGGGLTPAQQFGQIITGRLGS